MLANLNGTLRRNIQRKVPRHNQSRRWATPSEKRPCRQAVFPTRPARDFRAEPFAFLSVDDRFNRQLSRNPHWKASGVLHPHRSYLL